MAKNLRSAGLGRLILRGFTQKRRPKQDPVKSKAKSMPRAQNRSRVKGVAQAIVAPVQELIVTPSITSAHLFRPDSKMQKSIESFLLDLRSKHTRRAYGKDLKRFMKFLIERSAARHSPELLTRGVIIAYKESLITEKLEHTTIDRHLSTLRSFFRWLVEDGVIEKSPAENVRFLNPKRESRTNGFTNDEVIQMLKKPELHRKIGSLHYGVLMVLFYCALRRSELCELRTSNLSIEKDQRFLRLRGKGNAERIVILIPAVWEAIEHYAKMSRKDLRVDQPLFSPVRNNRTKVHSKPLDPSMVFYIVKKYAALAGIQNKVSPHSCRATAISNARDHNVPDRAIQEFAGWTTPNMITRYDKRKSALEKSAAHSIDYRAASSAKTNKEITTK